MYPSNLLLGKNLNLKKFKKNKQNVLFEHNDEDEDENEIYVMNSKCKK